MVSLRLDDIIIPNYVIKVKILTTRGPLKSINGFIQHVDLMIIYIKCKTLGLFEMDVLIEESIYERVFTSTC